MRGVLGLRTIGMSSLFLVFCLVMITPCVAQYKQYKNPSPHYSKVNPSASRLPRSVPSAAVPELTGRNASQSAAELNRLEHAPIGRANTASHRVSGGVVKASNVSKSRSESTPINFTYRGRNNGQADHRNSATKSH